jgi:hypothetical protein
MSIPPAALFAFDFFAALPVQVEVSDAPLTSDAGLLPLRQFDERIRLTEQFAAALDDPRDPELIEHTFSEMVRSRIFGIQVDGAHAAFAELAENAVTAKLLRQVGSAGHEQGPDRAGLANPPHATAGLSRPLL